MVIANANEWIGKGEVIMGKRDEFNKPTIDSLAKRVSFLCSNPTCKRTTIGPHSSVDKSTLIGVAAHITAAAAGGPRYNANLSESDRKSIENGIWLCETCARIIDKDPDSYPVSLLQKWKIDSEKAALIKLKGDTEYLPKPILEMDLVFNNCIRSSRGYAEVDYEDGERVINAGVQYKMHFNMDWNHKLVLMNNSSHPAFNVKIEMIDGGVLTHIEDLPKVNNIPPFENKNLKLKHKEFFTGTVKEADELLKHLIPPLMQGLKLKVTYRNEAREEFETIVQFNNGEVENII